MATDAPALAISVAMATFNGAKYVAEQLDSFAAQTRLPDELQIGDDGSEDATLEIVERFAARAPFPVVVTRNPIRLGVLENFLSIVGRARGPIIALSDWDDVWNPRKLERIAPWFLDPAVGLVVHRATVVDETLQPLGRTFPSIGRTRVWPARGVDPWFSGTGMGVFRKSLIEAVGAHGAERPHEADGHPMDHDDWIYHLSGVLGTTVLLAEDLALYRQHGGSYMGAAGGDLQERVDRGLHFDGSHFQRLATMFRERSDFWLRVARDQATAATVRGQAERAAAWCRRLATLQDARAGVRDGAAGRLLRVGRLLRLTFKGGYRQRTKAGLGALALAADAFSVVRGRNASRLPPDDLAARVAAARAEGRTPAAIIAELTQEGLSPPYGNRWTPETVRDLVFRARRASERKAIDAATAGASHDAEPSGVTPQS